MKYYLIAGEASGDLHASNLMRALLKNDPGAQFRFYGGDLMQSIAGTLVKHYRTMAYMGFIPVMLHLKTILRNMRECKSDILQWQPDALILIDYPGFNLDIAKYIRKNTSIPIYYYISPKIWAWKEYRIKNIRRDVTQLYSILPFETEYFATKHNYQINYVGNPCVDAIADVEIPIKRSETIAILAGSRKQEIKDNLKKMLLAAANFPQYKLILAATPSIDIEYYKKYIPNGINVEIVYNKTYEILANAKVALVTSGTATLETALLNTPQVVCYYFNFGKLLRMLKKLVLKVKYVSLVNLITGKETVKELLGDQMNIRNITNELNKLLNDESTRTQMLNDYQLLNDKIGKAGASERAAESIIKHIKNHGTI